MKMLVNVMVPAILQRFDMLLPDFLEMKDVTALVVEAVMEKTNCEYRRSGEEVLCYKEKNIILASDLNLKDYGIKNGDSLILI